MSTTFSPLEDRVLILPIKQTEVEKTSGGIIIADTVKKEVMEGIVVAVGVGRYAYETGVWIPTVLGVGDKILCGTNQGMAIEVPNENGGKDECRLMREGDVLLLISKKEEE